MDEHATLHGMNIDDAYVVERRLARGPAGTTELVTLGDVGPFVRKRLLREAGPPRGVGGALSMRELTFAEDSDDL